MESSSMEYSHSPTESLQDKRTSDSSRVESTSSVMSPAAPIPISDNVQDQKQPKHEQSVVVPDMFSSFMAADPVVNPNYHKVKAKGDAWITKVINADSTWDAKNRKVDLCYLAAIWAPHCDEEALRMMLDWNHWVFLFDDQFDEGHLSKDSVAAQEEVDQTMAIMTDTKPPVRQKDNPLRYIFQTCWDRLKRRADPELRQRYIDMHRRFFDGLLEQLKVTDDQREFSRDVDEYMHMRRGTIGAYPAIALSEYAVGIQLDNDVVAHPSLQECMCVSADLVLLVNDILSYKKDLALGVDHNLVSLLVEQGLSTQQALDKTGDMLDDCYRRWYSALANMPVYGEEIDRQVLRFIDTCSCVALGNLYWSFKTGRYLGAEGDEVHETRKMTLPPFASALRA